MNRQQKKPMLQNQYYTCIVSVDIYNNGRKKNISFVRTSSTAVLLGPHTRTRIFLILILADEDEEAA